jgi:SAM-dependent methyltransferase
VPPRFYSTDLAYVYDAGFNHYATRAAPQLLRLLRSHGLQRGLVVEFGCGSGTVAGQLAAAGYDVLGIDISQAMIRLARAKAPDATFRVGALATTRIPRCAAIIAIGEVIAYIGGTHQAATLRTHENELISFFARAYAALNPGGLLVVDFVESARGRTYPTKSLAGDDWVIYVRATADRSGRTLTRQIVTARKTGRGARTSRETHRLRIYPRAAMRSLLAGAGFQVAIRRSIGGVRLMRGDVVAIAIKDTKDTKGTKDTKEHKDKGSRLTPRFREPTRLRLASQ